MILNMDNDESRRMIELCYRTHTTLCNPIIDWTDEDVWTYIKEEGIPYCSLYDEGFKRLGCVGCPLGGKKSQKREFERWPQYKKLYLRAFEEMLKKRRELGKETAWETAEDVMNWWLRDTPDKHEVPSTNSGGGNYSNEHKSERAYEGDAGQSQAAASADPAGGRDADR